MTLILHVSSNSPQALPSLPAAAVEKMLVKLHLGQEEVGRVCICISSKIIL